MKIAFFTHHFPKISESFIINQVAGLMKRGHEVTIFASKQPDENAQHDIVTEHNMLRNTIYTNNPESYFEGLKITIKSVLDLGVNSPTHLGNIRDAVSLGKSAPTYLANLKALLNHGKAFDIYHAHFGNVGRKWSFVADLPGQTPLITTFYGMDVSSFVHPNRYTWYEPFWSKCRLSIGISQYIRAQMIMLGCSEEQSIKLPIGIDIDNFRSNPTPYSAGETLQIASVARHTEKKGLKYAINTVAECQEQGMNVRLRIAGDGELRPRLEAQIRNLDIEDSVDLLGWQTQKGVRELLKDAHLFMLPSVTAADGDTEGQALVLQEAQAMGLPVISTYHSGIPEGIVENETGLLVPERDVEKLTDSIEYFYSNPQSVAEFGRTGINYIEKNFSNENLIDKQVEIYKSVV